MDVIVVYDIGKTNKKLLIFDEELKLIEQREQSFPENLDEDSFPCDDMGLLKQWIDFTLQRIIANPRYDVKAINFSTYGATLVYVDEYGESLTPIYNYLKPMPDHVLEGFYEKYEGVTEFSRKTASPALGMLNSGLQALWIKKTNPEVYSRTKSILHFPQFVSSLFTNKCVSEHTSIGCHTALWDFDNWSYHKWVTDENMFFASPISAYTSYEVAIQGKKTAVGIGIHDSSASLAPYIENSSDPFILVSTGTWCINMNPFNDEPLTKEQLEKDCLCYIGVHEKPVKSSRLFMGHIHDVNAVRIANHFRENENFFKKVEFDTSVLKEILLKDPKFFISGVPDDYIDAHVDLNQFDTAKSAYYQLIADLTRICANSIRLVIPENDTTKNLYISGGFARSELFVTLIATLFPDKEVFTSEIDNSTALGAALMVWNNMERSQKPSINLGLKKYLPLA